MKLRTILLSFATIAIVSASKNHGGDDDEHVNYKFEYGVYDPHTHDIKSHHEERHGKYVKGFYTLKEPDGTTRIVHYKAGPHTGFEAVVQKIGHARHPAHHGHGGYGHGHHGGRRHHGGHGHHGGTSYVGPRHHRNQGYGGHRHGYGH